MKFTVERAALVKMLKLTGGKSPSQKRKDRLVRLSACAARVFVEANEMTGGVEALVLEDGTCLLPHGMFLKVLQTYASKAHLSIRVDARTLKLGSTTLPVSGYSRTVTPPGDFQVFEVSDLSVLLPDAPSPEPEAEEPPAEGTPMAAPLTEAELNRLAAKEGAEHYLDFNLGLDNPLLPLAHAPQETEPPTVAPPAQPPAPSPAGSTSSAVRALGWEFFAPEILERLFVAGANKNGLYWAGRMWAVLGAGGLTTYSTAAEYNRVLVRLAVLARFSKCWVWKAYDDGDDPALEYGDWFGVLPLVRSALPPSEPKETEGQPSEASEAERDLLAGLLRAENDAVFEAVLAACGEREAMALALDLRHAAGMGDDFGAHVTFGGKGDDPAAQEAFFNEYGLSMREFDFVNIIHNRFYFCSFGDLSG